MKATVFHERGGPENLCYADVPTPVPGPDELLVRVEAATVNRGPHSGVRCDGFEIPGFRLPHVGGADPAGDVDTVGSAVEGWEPGQRIVVYPLLWCGECDFCARAYHGLVDQVRVRPSDTVLGMAAGSGIGAAAIQIAAPRRPGDRHDRLGEEAPARAGDRRRRGA